MHLSAGEWNPVGFPLLQLTANWKSRRPGRECLEGKVETNPVFMGGMSLPGHRTIASQRHKVTHNLNILYPDSPGLWLHNTRDADGASSITSVS